MIPSSPHPGSAIHRHRLAIRRSAAVLAAALVIGGAPLVARALGDDAVPEAGASELPKAEPFGNPTAQSPADPQVPSVPDLGAGLVAETPPEPEVVPESPLEIATRVMTDTYTWDERGPRVEELQVVLGIDADGWYSDTTLAAHRSALEFAGLPIDRLPVAPIPAGPAPERWAALRECESGGDYTITNPSGKYRGAYQFDRSTWNSVAERHAPGLVGADPAAAAPADQDAMARALYSERGARPWPHCGRHLR
jgi:hypothetical protein